MVAFVCNVMDAELEYVGYSHNVTDEVVVVVDDVAGGYFHSMD